MRAICDCIPEGSSVIDVGSDHAYVPIALVKSGKAQHALATDINVGPLQRSAENIRRFGCEKQIDVERADGLVGVDCSQYDHIIIAGMGGELIENILRHGAPAEGTTLVLQPMSAAMELRFYLSQNGYRITSEAFAKEGEKLYVIFTCVFGDDLPYSTAELAVGRAGRQHPLFSLYLNREIAKRKKKVSGLKKAVLRDVSQIDDLDKLISALEKIKT